MKTNAEKKQEKYNEQMERYSHLKGYLTLDPKGLEDDSIYYHINFHLDENTFISSQCDIGNNYFNKMPYALKLNRKVNDLTEQIDMEHNTSINHENGNDANRLSADVKITEFKVRMSFRAVVPFSQPNTMKVHIDHVLPSIYDDRKLIVYRVFGKHKQWWHEFMCTDEDMQWYKERAERK